MEKALLLPNKILHRDFNLLQHRNITGRHA